MSNTRTDDIRRYFAFVPADMETRQPGYLHNETTTRHGSLEEAGRLLYPETPAQPSPEAAHSSQHLQPPTQEDASMLSEGTTPRTDLLAVPVMDGADGDPCVSEEPSLDSHSGNASSLLCNESLDSDVPDPDAAYSEHLASQSGSAAELSASAHESPRHAHRADLDGSEAPAEAAESDDKEDEPPAPPRRRRRSNRALAVPAGPAVEEAVEERVVRPRRAPRKHVDSRSGHRHYRLQAKRYTSILSASIYVDEMLVLESSSPTHAAPCHAT
jgi:hypothetical protein